MGELLDLVQPVSAGDVDAALGLDRLDQERGRRGLPAGGVGEGGGVLGQGGLPAGGSLEGQAHHVRERHPGPLPEGVVRGRGEGAQGHAVEAVAEGDDLAPTGGEPRELQRRLDGVGAGGAHELHLVVHAAGSEDLLLELLDEVPLGGGVGVQGVSDTVRLEEVDHGALHARVVVPEVQHPRPGEEVDVGGAVLGDLTGVRRRSEHGGIRAAVPADLGFMLLEDAGVHGVASLSTMRHSGTEATLPAEDGPPRCGPCDHRHASVASPSSRRARAGRTVMRRLTAEDFNERSARCTTGHPPGRRGSRRRRWSPRPRRS